MVQVPVLALRTPWHELTHGLYCDDFAEFQSKDIPVRQMLGGFLPSNGVGTGFTSTLKSLVTTVPVLSVRATVNAKVPAWVGVPDRVPLESSSNPGGGEPRPPRIPQV